MVQVELSDAPPLRRSAGVNVCSRSDTMCCGSQSHSRSPEQRSSRSSLVEGQPVRTSLLIPCLEHVANAASRRRPARAGASSVVEDRGAHKGQTDRQLVGGGQGDYRLPSGESKGGRVRWGARCGPGGSRRAGVVAAQAACMWGRPDPRLRGRGHAARCRVQRGHPTEGGAWRGNVAHRGNCESAGCVARACGSARECG